MRRTLALVAILVPFRDRESHLRIFLYNFHPFLIRQNLDYRCFSPGIFLFQPQYFRIFVIHQKDNETFNRAMLLNVGYAEAMKVSDWDCLGGLIWRAHSSQSCITFNSVFHDVDLLPEDDRNLYTCPDQGGINTNINTNTHQSSITFQYRNSNILRVFLLP